MVLVWDEPERLRGAAERLWKRLDQPASAQPARRNGIPALGRTRRAAGAGAQLALRTRHGRGARAAHLHPAVDGLPRQHARGGRRGAQFCGEAAGGRCFSAPPTANWSAWPTSFRNTPFHSSLLSSLRRDPLVLSGRTRLSGGLGREHLPGRRVWCAAERCFSIRPMAIFGTEDLFGASEWAGRPAAKSTWALLRRPGRPQARRLRRPRRARRRPVPRAARDRSGRP